MTLCECGCGGEANKGKRFISGHNTRDKHQSRNHIEKRMESTSLSSKRKREEKERKRQELLKVEGGIRCEICKKYFDFINPTHLKTHEITVEQYRNMFPFAVFVSDKRREQLSEQMKGESNPSKRPEVIEKIRKKKLGKKFPYKPRPKMKGKLLGDNNPMNRPEVKEKHLITLRNPEVGAKISLAKKGKTYEEIYGEEKAKELRKLRSEQIYTKTEKGRKKLKRNKKEQWKDPIFAKKMFTAWNVKPNKPEIELENFLETVYPSEYKYVGDGKVWIDGLCPDFININGKKKLIELYGDYWHRNDTVEDIDKKIERFTKFGFEMLIIWEHQLQDKIALKELIIDFNKK